MFRQSLVRWTISLGFVSIFLGAAPRAVGQNIELVWRPVALNPSDFAPFQKKDYAEVVAEIRKTYRGKLQILSVGSRATVNGPAEKDLADHYRANLEELTTIRGSGAQYIPARYYPSDDWSFERRGFETDLIVLGPRLAVYRGELKGNLTSPRHLLAHEFIHFRIGQGIAEKMRVDEVSGRKVFFENAELRKLSTLEKKLATRPLDTEKNLVDNAADILRYWQAMLAVMTFREAEEVDVSRVLCDHAALFQLEDFDFDSTLGDFRRNSDRVERVITGARAAVTFLQKKVTDKEAENELRALETEVVSAEAKHRHDEKWFAAQTKREKTGKGKTLDLKELEAELSPEK